MSGVQQVLMAGGAVKVLTFQTSDTDTINRTVYTFTGKAIGTAAADRQVHVHVSGGAVGAQTITSVTVGGITATINVQAANGNLTCGIVTAAVPTGTTADIIVTFTGGKGNCHIGVWSSTGLASSAAFATGSSTADPGTATLNSIGGGFVIAGALNDATTTVSWTNATEQYDFQSDSHTCSGASGQTTTTTIAPSGDYAVSGTNQAVFATF